MADVDPTHEHLLQFTDAAVQKLTEHEQQINVLAAKVEEVVKGHEGDTRDELKARLDDFEKKLHILMEEHRNRQGGQIK